MCYDLLLFRLKHFHKDMNMHMLAAQGVIAECMSWFLLGVENHAYFLRLHHIPGSLLDDAPAAHKLSSTDNSPVLQTDTLML